MKLYGVSHAPDGYEPGAWDEVRAAFLDGHISEEAYNVVRGALPQDREKRKNLPDTLRYEVFAEDNWTCRICGNPVVRRRGKNRRLTWQKIKEWAPTADHIIPWSVSEDNSRENLRTAHKLCNELRGADELSDLEVAKIAHAQWALDWSLLSNWLDEEDRE